MMLKAGARARARAQSKLMSKDKQTSNMLGDDEEDDNSEEYVSKQFAYT